MAGRKPKPTELHHIEGTFNSTRHRDRENEPKIEGKPVRPKFLRGKAAKIWDEYVRIAYWLTEADSHAFAIWCGLMAEAERGITKMVSSRLSQLRSYGAELGLAGPSSRTRINVFVPTATPGGPSPNAPQENDTDRAEAYFTKPN